MRLLTLIIIFYCNIIFATTPYEGMLKELWDKVSYEAGIDDERGFLAQDIQEFLENTEGKALLFFFPKKCGFDFLTNKKFIELEDFFDLAQEHGFEISYCSSQRHLVSFKDREEMEEFVRDVFGTELIEGEIPLYFPSKIMITILEPAFTTEEPKATCS
jgi:hypothetical protein